MGIIKSKKNKVRIWENKLDLFLPSEPLIPSMHFFLLYGEYTIFFSKKRCKLECWRHLVPHSVACVYIRWIGMITKVNFLTRKIFDSFVNKTKPL